MKSDSTLQAQAPGVGSGDVQRFSGDVGGMDFNLRQFFRERQGDAARAGADVHDAGRIFLDFGWSAGVATPPIGHQFQHPLDDMLGLRTGYEHGWGYQQAHPPELLG